MQDSSRGGSSKGGRFESENVSFNENQSRQQETDTAQIEYLIHQSTLGVHFLFAKNDIVRVLKNSKSDREFFTSQNMERVQGLLTRFLEKQSLEEKQSFMEHLDLNSQELLIRAYFHLVDNSIVSNADFKH